MGPEAIPVLPHALELLKAWTKQGIWRGWPPRQGLEAFLTNIGQNSKEAKGKLIPLIKELLADKATTPNSVNELQTMLDKLEG